MNFEAGRGRDVSDGVAPNDGPSEPWAHRIVSLEPRPAPPPARTRPLHLDDDLATGSNERSTPAQQPVGVAADSDVAVEEEDGLPAPGAGQSVEHRPLEDGTASPSGQGDGRRRRVDTQHSNPPPSQSVEHPPRTAPDVENGCGQARQELALAG